MKYSVTVENRLSAIGHRQTARKKVENQIMERYVLVLYTPLYSKYIFCRPDFIEAATLDWAEREALGWKSANLSDGVVQSFCIGIVPYRGNRDVETQDVIEAF